MSQRSPNSLYALGVDPSIDTRMLLKQAALSLADFKRIDFVNNAEEVTRYLAHEDTGRVDVIFFSHMIPDADVKRIIFEASESDKAQDAAFVLLLRTQDRNNALVASKILLGIDGFIFEPYSVEDLNEIVSLAALVKRTRSKSRDVAALTYLVCDLASDIDRAAYLKSNGFDLGSAWSIIREKSRAISSIPTEMESTYYDIAVRVFTETEAPHSDPLLYGGVSTRLRKRVAARLFESMEQQAGVPDKR